MLNIPKIDIPDNCLEPENEDLKTIKTHMRCPTGRDYYYCDICLTKCRLIEAAERMAARIAEREKQNCSSCKYLCGPNDVNCVECMNGVFDYMSVNNISVCALKCNLWEVKR